jgi:hypothetical protein
MIYPNTTITEWSAQYDILPTEAPCKKCGARQTIDVPFAYKSLRGFAASPHNCGPLFQRIVCKSIDPVFAAAVKDLLAKG